MNPHACGPRWTGGGWRPLLLALALGTPLAAQSSADPSAAVLIERAAATARNSAPMRAEVTQRLINPRTGNVLTSRGEFFQRGPTRFAFRFAEPPEDRIVADGQVIWVYLPSAAKGQVLKLPAVAGAGLDLVGTLLRDPTQRYTITALADTTAAEGRLRRVALVPTAPGPFTRAELWLAPSSAEVYLAEFQEASGMVRQLRFSRVRRGVTLPRDIFHFSPPPGVRVIDQAAMLGGMVPPR